MDESGQYKSKEDNHQPPSDQDPDEAVSNRSTQESVTTHPELECNMAEQNIQAESGQDKVCSLHEVNDNSSMFSGIICFKDDTLVKCRKILMVRKTKHLKYFDITLPPKVDNVHGYHHECYKKFTALPKAHRIIENLTSSQEKEASSTRVNMASPKPKDRTGVFQPLCLFCESNRKKVKNVEQKLISVETTQFAANIMEYAEMRGDQKLLTQIKDQDFVAKEVKYHACCRSNYQTKAKAISKKLNIRSNLNKEKQVHSEAFDSLINYIEENVIARREVHSLTDLNSYYAALIHDVGGNDFQDSTPTAQKLSEKIDKHFRERIIMQKGKTKRGCIVHSSMVTKEEAMDHKYNNKIKLRDVALMLREAIMKAPQRQLPSKLTMEDVSNGEVDAPNEVVDFFKYLLAGPDSRIWKHPSKQRRIKAMSQDAVFSATSGRKKPGKHLVTALALKSMTGSRKVIEIINRMGHCASYHTTEEIETELTLSYKDSDSEVPFGMYADSEYGTGVAWDNFDRFVETLSGKSTLHDTVGIAYQLNNNDTSSSHQSVSSDSPCQSEPSVCASRKTHSLPSIRVGLSKKRRRTYESFSDEIPPYHKKPRLDNPELLPKDDRRLQISEKNNDISSWRKDVLWMIDVWHNSDSPMWVGWNSKRVEDTRKQMKVWYLPQINQSPTSNAVVAETMRRSQVIAEQSKKSYILLSPMTWQ